MITGRLLMKKPKITKNGIVLFHSILFTLIIGFIFGYLISNINKDDNGASLQKKYNLLDKRIFLDNPSDIIINFSPLKQQLQNYNTVLNAKGVTESLYFEYLPTGSSIGINSTQDLVGASLLKVPLAMDLYKASEEGKINLNTKITLQKAWLDNSFGDLYKKGAGYQLTLGDADRIMLTNSDNTAALAVYYSLIKVMPIDQILLSFVDSQYSVNKNQSINIGAQSYSKILQCLYYSCYISPQDSQQILQYLTESPYNNRITADLPHNITVAHKIGEYNTPTTNVQSDCGIVYLTNRNYLLCIMVTGTDPEASSEIATISQTVYSYLSNVNPYKTNNLNSP